MSLTQWNILYRGSLSSCNYACSYCPFAKTKNTRSELAHDAQELQRFVNWVSDRTESIGILFTPWGEALIRRSYQEAMIQLSHLQNVHRVAIQTNISCSTKWLKRANKKTLALWTTFHPSQISLEKFVGKCQELDALGVRYSVGFVGFKEDLEVLEQLRERLSPTVYLWVNAYKRVPDYYEEADIKRIEKIDPLFRYNTKYHTSLGKACRTGHTTFSVDGNGDMRRCHFIKRVIGNIYKQDFDAVLKPTPCTNNSCGCHIGYVHLEELNLQETYGNGLLERIPREL